MLLPPSTILRRCACRPSPCQTPNVIAAATDAVDQNGVPFCAATYVNIVQRVSPHNGEQSEIGATARRSVCFGVRGPRSVKQTCPRHVCSVGHSGYAARRPRFVQRYIYYIEPQRPKGCCRNRRDIEHSPQIWGYSGVSPERVFHPPAGGRLQSQPPQSGGS